MLGTAGHYLSPGWGSEDFEGNHLIFYENRRRDQSDQRVQKGGSLKILKGFGRGAGHSNLHGQCQTLGGGGGHESYQ